MRNLKRVLTLVMAVAMMMSLLVVGAGAAFPDQDKIENTDAVNMNVALGIIKGRDTGVFDPTGNVTRAEMAKMICIVLNGGNEPTVGAKATPTFKDIKGHWAEGYIEYCAALGIVAGMGDGTFAPNANVTGTQAAKMLLVALGYDAAFEGFNGASWAVKINVAASQKVLYDELAIDPNAPLNRDNAAQMVWNALNATEVKYEYSLTTVNGQLMNIQKREDKVDTLLKVRFKTGADFAQVMTGYSWNSSDKKFTYTFANGTQFKSKEDFTNLFAMNVKVVYKGTAGTSATVYGMYGDDAKVLATGIMDDLEIVDGTEIKFDGVKYKLDNSLAGTNVYAENATATLNLTSATLISSNAVTAAYAPYNARLIDNDNDGKVDCIVYLPFIIEKITYVDSKSVSTNNNSYKFEDCDIYSGIAKNDWVMVINGANATKGDDILKKMDVVSGTITSLKSGGQIVIDGKTYTNAANVSGDTGYKIGNKMELIVVNGFTFNAKKLSTAVTNNNMLITLLADSVGATGTTDAGKQKVKVMFADGTKKTVTVDKIEGNDVVAATNVVALETIYTFSIDKDGNYELEAITAGSNGNYDNVYNATNAGLKDGKIAADVSGRTVRFADDAVVFYRESAAGDYKVASGATVNKWAAYTAGAGTGVNARLFANETDGFQYTQVGFITLSAAPSDDDTLYGYITAKPELVKSGDDYYYQIKVWNGTETKTYNAESTGAAGTSVNSSSSLTNADVAKGTAVSFKLSGDGIVEKVTALSAGSKNAVIAYSDGKNFVGFQSAVGSRTDLKLTTDSVIIRFSSDDVASQTGNGITVAKETAVSGVYTQNCYVIANVDGEIEALFIDKDSNLGNVAAPAAAVVLAAGSTQPATVTGGPATLVAGGAAGAVTGWLNNTADTVKITATPVAGTTCTMTINGVAYVNGANYDVPAAGLYTVVATVSGTGLTTTTYTYTFNVVAAPNAAAPAVLSIAAVDAITVDDADLLDGAALTGFAATTADKVTITATAAAGTTCTMTIDGAVYTSGSTYTIAATGTYTVAVTVSGAGFTTHTYTYSITVA